MGIPPDGPAERASEIASTLSEMRDYFSESEIIEGMAASGIGVTASPGTREAILQALRAYSVLILESEKPKLTAQLVGKLAKLDIGAGRRIDLNELAAQCGVSKQAISNRLKVMAERLGLERPDSTTESREAHRLHNRRNYGSRAIPAFADS